MSHPSPLLQEGMPGLERRSGLSARDFIREFVVPGRPVILSDNARQWPAMGKWTPAFFSRKYGHLSREVKGVRYTVAEQMELIQRSSEEHPAPYTYSLNIDTELPELKADMEPFLLGSRDRLASPLFPAALFRGTVKHEVFFGGRGSVFPIMHVDLQHLHTQITQLYGEKEFFLVPPDQGQYLYPRPEYPLYSSIPDVFNPDLERFPLFSKIKGYRALVNEGETIFFPTGWWHMTRMHGPCISYGRALLARDNYPAFLRDTYEGWKKSSPAKAPLAYAAGRVAGLLMTAGELVSSA